tara:strand:+ start:805 stop:963 length:159 start_codon:yes stop_codon:yes gene_type:complete
MEKERKNSFNVLNMRTNWIITLMALAITFLGVITKKFFFLLFIIPLSLLWKK